MKIVVLDSQPILAYFEKDDGWESVAELLQLAAEEKVKLLLSVVNWGEVHYVTLREYGEGYAEQVLQAISNMPIDIVEADREMTLQAARLKAKGGISYADCFAGALAIMNKGELLTGDKEFKQVEKEVKVRWM